MLFSREVVENKPSRKLSVTEAPSRLEHLGAGVCRWLLLSSHQLQGSPEWKGAMCPNCPALHPHSTAHWALGRRTSSRPASCTPPCLRPAPLLVGAGASSPAPVEKDWGAMCHRKWDTGKSESRGRDWCPAHLSCNPGPTVSTSRSCRNNA